MTDITSANAIITIAVSSIFSTPVQLQGFSADNIYDLPEQEIIQTSMGVDGRLSGGFIFNPTDQTFMLQPDSPSIRFFERWAATMTTQKAPYVAQGRTKLLSVNRSYVMNKGFLVSLPKAPAAGRVLQPRRFMIRWESVVSNAI